jgi:hypothetical protein
MQECCKKAQENKNTVGRITSKLFLERHSATGWTGLNSLMTGSKIGFQKLGDEPSY